MKPTCTRRRPVEASASTTCLLASELGVSGFSHRTGLFASRQARISPSCVSGIDAISTASTSGSAISSRPSAYTPAAPASRAAARARSRSTSATAVTVAPFTAVASVRTCELPIAPAPITPTLISSNPLARSAESTHTPGYDHLAVDEQADGVRVVVWAHVEHDEPSRRASGHGRPIEAIAGFSVVVERRTQLLRAGRHRSDDHV